MTRRSFCVAILALTLIAPTHAAGKAFAWKASNKQGVVYLVGSVHLLSKDFYPLNPALDAAYKDSGILVEEVDLGEMSQPGNQAALLARGLMPGGQSLEKILSPSTLELLKKHLPDLGDSSDAIKSLKPWLIALTIESVEWAKAGFDPNLGLDKHFYDRAIADNKPVQGLETMSFQVSLFDDMPMDQQDKLLASTLKDVDSERANMSKLVSAWRDGDAPAVERIVLAELKSDSAIYQRMLVDRNRAWVPKIEQLFGRSGHALVIVGAAHLVGPDGLLAQLRSKGYTIEQM